MSILSKFYHQITGPEDKPKLVFLHGVMGFTANWRRIAKAFEDNYQVLVYDQRGHGRSFQPAIGYAPENYAEDLEGILDELGWSKIALVGHSMGGRVAYHFASQNPQRLTHLVIEDIGPSMNASTGGFVARMLDTVPVPFASKKEAKLWFDHEFPLIFKDQSNVMGLSAYLYANITENEDKEAVWRFSVPGIRESIAQGRATERWDDLGQLSVPTLLVRGENSKDLPRDLYEKVLAANRHIEGVEIKNSGHWVHSDQPELFIEVVRRFLDGQKTGRGLGH